MISYFIDAILYRWALKSYIELKKSVGLTLNHVEFVNATYVDYCGVVACKTWFECKTCLTRIICGCFFYLETHCFKEARGSILSQLLISPKLSCGGQHKALQQHSGRFVGIYTIHALVCCAVFVRMRCSYSWNTARTVLYQM